MRELGMFINVSRTDGLKYRDIVSCLSPVIRILRVPDEVSDQEIEGLINAQGIGTFIFGYGYREYQLIPVDEWVHDPLWVRFDLTADFNSLLRGAIDDSKLVA